MKCLCHPEGDAGFQDEADKRTAPYRLFEFDASPQTPPLFREARFLDRYRVADNPWVRSLVWKIPQLSFSRILSKPDRNSLMDWLR
jgi:hypothetical protein